MSCELKWIAKDLAHWQKSKIKTQVIELLALSVAD